MPNKTLTVRRKSCKYSKMSKSKTVCKKSNLKKKTKVKKPIKIKYFLSDVEMTTFKNRICTQYKKLPLCNPDFIYLDGPDQFSPTGSIRGVTTNHKDRMPMAADILVFEHFLTGIGFL